MATFSLRWRFIYRIRLDGEIFRLDGEIFRLDGEIFGGKTSLATSRARVEAEVSEADSIPNPFLPHALNAVLLISFHRKCSLRRFTKVNSPTSSSTYS